MRKGHVRKVEVMKEKVIGKALEWMKLKIQAEKQMKNTRSGEKLQDKF